MSLLNKNIILISPAYFGYEASIARGLEAKGASVYFIDDRIKNTTINKIAFRLKLKQTFKKNDVLNYFINELSKCPKKIDYLLAIIPEGFSREIIEHYRALMKETVFILYMWDSIENRPYIIDTLNLYNRTFTFDRLNSIKYGMNFRPLFFERLFENSNFAIKEFKYDVSFIGTAHSDRYSIIKRLQIPNRENFTKFFYFYLQSPLVYVYYYVTDRKFRKLKFSDVRYKSLSKTIVADIVKSSKCIIDINHPKQSGLTMRTLEVLGAKRKLITTNQDVINYDFYNSTNVIVIDRYFPKVEESFLNVDFVDIDKEIYDKYSLSEWINEIFS